MIVFLAGMPRSGSTFAFNVARRALQARGQLYQEAPPDGDIVGVLSRSRDADHILVKSHDADETSISLARQGAVRIICTVRRVEDAVASWMQTFEFAEEDSIETMRRWLIMYRRIRPYALTVPYHLVDTRPWFATFRIGKYLFRDFTVGEAWRTSRATRKSDIKARMDSFTSTEAGATDIGFSIYDAETFFHRRHVSSLSSRPAETRLPTLQIGRIRAALATEIRDANL